jgi:hypothetical protein
VVFRVKSTPMGNLPTPDYEADDSCESCFGVNKPHGDFPTPKLIKATFAGMEACPGYGSTKNGEYILEQHEDYPCFYSGDTGGPPYGVIEYTMVYFEGGEYKSELVMWDGSICWFVAWGNGCDVEFENVETGDNCGPFGPHAYGGTAFLSWGPEIG